MLAKRKGENFSRVKPSTLVKLINTDTNPESIYSLNNEFEEFDVNDNNDTKSNFTSTSKVSH